jgi:hypothetical protein
MIGIFLSGIGTFSSLVGLEWIQNGLIMGYPPPPSEIIYPIQLGIQHHILGLYPQLIYYSSEKRDKVI